MYYLLLWASAFSGASFAPLCFLQRYRSEWIDSVERLWTELSHTRSIFEKSKHDEKSHIMPLAERISQLESRHSLLLSRLEKLEDTPEKRSKDAAKSAVQDILKGPW